MKIRTFTFNGIDLPDPGPEYEVDDVRRMYSSVHPELATAKTAYLDQEGNYYQFEPVTASASPATSGKSQNVKFQTSVGRKG
jgi:PRTRC genetic system protein C